MFDASLRNIFVVKRVKSEEGQRMYVKPSSLSFDLRVVGKEKK
jgi:hypothetical protein